ncbi:hypothetical protein PV04_04817 [Phialophora macrospora]|uniref:Uncharacterized protein n=1 Tax=Phialophora macrospora TaxID=1851006 RepID=A0A0D2FLA0_9EURO|nr:hypothetical protein PV04_04817 [Phialophora macrospora]
MEYQGNLSAGNSRQINGPVARDQNQDHSQHHSQDQSRKYRSGHGNTLSETRCGDIQHYVIQQTITTNNIFLPTSHDIQPRPSIGGDLRPTRASHRRGAEVVRGNVQPRSNSALGSTGFRGSPSSPKLGVEVPTGRKSPRSRPRGDVARSTLNSTILGVDPQSKVTKRKIIKRCKQMILRLRELTARAEQQQGDLAMLTADTRACEERSTGNYRNRKKASGSRHDSPQLKELQKNLQGTRMASNALYRCLHELCNAHEHVIHINLQAPNTPMPAIRFSIHLQGQDPSWFGAEQSQEKRAALVNQCLISLIRRGDHNDRIIVGDLETFMEDSGNVIRLMLCLELNLCLIPLCSLADLIDKWGKSWTIRTKLQYAVLVAEAFLKFSGSLISATWTSHDVVVFGKNGQADLRELYLKVIQSPPPPTSNRGYTPNTAASDRLRCLGIILAELGLGRTRLRQDEPTSTATPVSNMGKDLEILPRPYPQIVLRCMSPDGRKDGDLRDSDAFFNGVICPLHKMLDRLNRIESKESGPSTPDARRW